MLVRALLYSSEIMMWYEYDKFRLRVLVIGFLKCAYSIRKIDRVKIGVTKFVWCVKEPR